MTNINWRLAAVAGVGILALGLVVAWLIIPSNQSHPSSPVSAPSTGAGSKPGATGLSGTIRPEPVANGFIVVELKNDDLGLISSTTRPVVLKSRVAMSRSASLTGPGWLIQLSAPMKDNFAPAKPADPGVFRMLMYDYAPNYTLVDSYLSADAGRSWEWGGNINDKAFKANVTYQVAFLFADNRANATAPLNLPPELRAAVGAREAETAGPEVLP